MNEKITPAERSLYFHTAHDHFKAGCPALALEVLSKLPQVFKTRSVGYSGCIELINFFVKLSNKV